MITFFLTSLFVMFICVIAFGLCVKNEAMNEGAVICVIAFGLCVKNEAMNEGAVISVIGVLSGICAGCSWALIALQLVIQWISEAVK